MAIIPVIDLGSLWVGDVPTSPTRADFVDEVGNPVQVGEFNSWAAYMLSPDMQILGELDGEDHGNHLDFTWPTVTILEMSGVHTIVITFFDLLGVELQCEPFKFVVQELN